MAGVKVTTLVKFMTKEELVEMLVQIKNFKHPVTRKWHHKFKTTEECWADPWNRAKYKFRMDNLDFVDALINDDGGYVRYTGASEEVLDMLKVKFGFELEGS